MNRWIWTWFLFLGGWAAAAGQYPIETLDPWFLGVVAALCLLGFFMFWGLAREDTKVGFWALLGLVAVLLWMLWPSLIRERDVMFWLNLAVLLGVPLLCCVAGMWFGGRKPVHSKKRTSGLGL